MKYNEYTGSCTSADDNGCRNTETKSGVNACLIGRDSGCENDKTKCLGSNEKEVWKKKEKLKERGWTGGDGAKMRIGQNGKNRN